MALSPEIVRAMALEWIGHELTEREAGALSEMYEAMARSLEAFPREKLRGVEPAFHSVPSLRAGETGR